MLTGLPLFWPEGGVVEALAGPPPDRSWQAALGARAAVPIDTSSASALAGRRLLLAAQPRDQSPADLVALDAWVRRGGRMLWLADPALARPSRLALGDPRAAPAGPTLLPLMAHWQLSVTRQGVESAAACERAWDGLAADCRIGRGRVILVADADLLFEPAGAAQIATVLDSLEQGRPIPRESSAMVPIVLLMFLALALMVGLLLIARRRLKP